MVGPNRWTAFPQGLKPLNFAGCFVRAQARILQSDEKQMQVLRHRSPCHPSDEDLSLGTPIATTFSQDDKLFELSSEVSTSKPARFSD